METVLIRIYPGSSVDKPPTAEWLALGPDRKPIGEAGYGALDEAATVAHYRRAIVLVPSEDILLTRVDIKARNREQLLRAMPYALEEELAEDVEQLHFAPGPRQPDGSHPVAVVARAHMTQWLSQLSTAGLTPYALIPDVMALPAAADNGWSLLLEKDRALLRAGAFNGFTLERTNLEALLSCALEEAAVQPPVVEVYRCDGGAGDPPPPIPSIDYESREGCPPQLWAAGLDEKRAINLLQGQFRIKSDIGRLLKPWRTAAALLGVWIALQAVGAAVDYQRLAAEERSLQRDIKQVYRDTFPNEDRIPNARVQMEQHLLALREAADSDAGDVFMRLLDAGARAVEGAPGVSIETFDYLNGQLNLSLAARELQSFEIIKQKIEGEGLTADIESADTRGDRVNGRLVIDEARG
jgi:general secretion pathway protein L